MIWYVMVFPDFFVVSSSGFQVQIGSLHYTILLARISLIFLRAYMFLLACIFDRICLTHEISALPVSYYDYYHSIVSILSITSHNMRTCNRLNVNGDNRVIRKKISSCCNVMIPGKMSNSGCHCNNSTRKQPLQL